MDARATIRPTESLPQRLRRVRTLVRREYLAAHSRPWVVGFSAGKDSTVLLQLVLEVLLAIPPDERVRPIFVLSNDTLVESPVFQTWVDTCLDRIREGGAALKLPVIVVQTRPDPSNSFWVNVLGRGYPAPNRSFRWCTDRMKIRPTTDFIRTKVAEAGEVILLLGVRKAESAVRAGRIRHYSEKTPGSHLNPHNDIPGCLIFRPIVDLTNDDIWNVLAETTPPWGGDHSQLIALYRQANGGECPFVFDPDDAPSCGSTSARFGCWTCTVVEKDNSLTGLIASGYGDLAPLATFRERLKAISNDPYHRATTRRNGRPGLGPLTVQTRKMLLDELLALQDTLGICLLTVHERRLIEDQWKQDSVTEALRHVTARLRL